jgi:hypothetical protein
LAIGAAWATETSEPTPKAVVAKMEKIRTNKSPLIKRRSVHLAAALPNRAFFSSCRLLGALSKSLIGKIVLPF